MELTKNQKIWIGVGAAALLILIYWKYSKKGEKKDGYYPPPPPNDSYLEPYLQRPARSRQKVRFTMPSMQLDGTNTEYELQ